MRLILLAVALTFSVPTLLTAQNDKQKAAIDREIRKLDLAHADAILRADLPALDKIWTKDFVVNNPFNEVDKADRIRTGAVTLFFIHSRARVGHDSWKHSDRNGARNGGAQGKFSRRGKDDQSTLHKHLDETRRQVAAGCAPRQRHLPEVSQVVPDAIHVDILNLHLPRA